MGISKEELGWAIKHWTTSNYIAAASVYLKDNFLLERELTANDIKDKLVGHWGTCPGLNFIYSHLNLLASKTKQSILPIVGPGHGFASILANAFIDGTLNKYYPEYNLGKTIKSFCWPGGFPSHANPGFPGIIYEGGELGYALSTAFGAAFDNPDLLVAAIIGDGEAETGPTAAAWHSNKFLNPKRDGAVLPILHLNGYKIANPTIFGTMSDQELRNLFTGYGYDVKFVGENHKQMYNTLEWAHDKIRRIKKLNPEKPKWPMIILKTKKGWTCPKKDSDGNPLEGSWRSHQVPIKDITNPESLKLIEKWLKSYKPERLFENGKVPDKLLKFIPEEKITDNPHAIGGNLKKYLLLPDPRKYEVRLESRGSKFVRSTEVLGDYLKEVFSVNNNFRLFSPDELESNRLESVLDTTKKVYIWPSNEKSISKDGKVMEILSEHTLQGWYQGYVLTGRYGLFPCYESFLPIIDSMVAQHLKFLKVSKEYSWRKPISSLNYLLTSVCWRQDHNGFSHQNPGFINMVLSKATEEQLVRIYLPADANSLLAIIKNVMSSTDKVNLIVADKQPIRQWLTYDEAEMQAKKGIAVWKFASDENPDIVLAAAGDYQTAETLAAIKIAKKLAPEVKIRMVNVSELNILGGPTLYPDALNEKEFESIFTNDKHVIFSFHGYPETIKQLLFDRPNTQRFHVYGYIEKGGTTTPFDMLIQNKVSRYHIAIRVLEHAAKSSLRMKLKVNKLIRKLSDKILEHQDYIRKYDKDPDEITNWTW